LTVSRSTRSGCCTPTVTSTCIVRELMPRLRIRLSELWWIASSTARTAAFV